MRLFFTLVLCVSLYPLHAQIYDFVPVPSDGAFSDPAWPWRPA